MRLHSVKNGRSKRFWNAVIAAANGMGRRERKQVRVNVERIGQRGERVCNHTVVARATDERASRIIERLLHSVLGSTMFTI